MKETPEVDAIAHHLGDGKVRVVVQMTHPEFDGTYGEVSLHPLEAARLAYRIAHIASGQLSVEERKDLLGYMRLLAGEGS